MNFSGNSTRSARRELSGESFKRIRSNICAVNFFFYVNQFISYIYTVPYSFVLSRTGIRTYEYEYVRVLHDRQYVLVLYNTVIPYAAVQ